MFSPKKGSIPSSASRRKRWTCFSPPTSRQGEAKAFLIKKGFFCEIRSFRLEHIFRGLDIAGVKTVVNYQVCDGRKKTFFSPIYLFFYSCLTPWSSTSTGWAGPPEQVSSFLLFIWENICSTRIFTCLGRSGRSISLADEDNRKMVREIVKNAR